MSETVSTVPFPWDFDLDEWISRVDRSSSDNSLQKSNRALHIKYIITYMNVVEK